MDVIKTLQAEWPAVSAAPWSFAIIACLAVGIGFAAATFYFGGTISTLRERLALYQDRLNGATPDQAKAKIDALEEVIRNTVGGAWHPLTTQQSDRLTNLVKDLPKRRIQIMYSNYRGRDLAQSFADAFKKAGWTDVLFSEGGGLGDGISTGRGNGMAATLASAIKRATNMQVNRHGEDEPDQPGSVFVAVGIKKGS